MLKALLLGGCLCSHGLLPFALDRSGLFALLFFAFAHDGLDASLFFSLFEQASSQLGLNSGVMLALHLVLLGATLFSLSLQRAILFGELFLDASAFLQLEQTDFLFDRQLAGWDGHCRLGSWSGNWSSSWSWGWSWSWSWSWSRRSCKSRRYRHWRRRSRRFGRAL